jgi:membrane fusion protein, multidrug efflux system
VKKILPFLIFLLLSAAAVAFIYKDKLMPQQSGGQSAEQGGGGGGGGRRGGRRRGGGDPNRAVTVLAEEAKAQDVPVYLSGVGTVQASNTVNVRPQVGGKLLSVNVREGQEVKAGDVLAQIDPVTYQAIYDQAAAKKAISEALLANARRDLERYENLSKNNYGTQKDLDTQKALVQQYEAQIRQDQASIDSAKANLDFTTIRAPLDGRTGIRVVDVGNIVSAGDSSGITFITQIKPIDVLFTLPEIYVGELLAAQSAGRVALTASVNDQTLGEGALSVIDNRIDEATGTVKLKGSFPNDPVKLWPGQFVNVRLHLKTLPGATVVPSVAVQQGSTGRFVYLAQPDNTAKRMTVKVVQEDENQAVIGEGVKPGDKVITSGFVNIQDGSKITLEGAQPAAPAGQDGAQPAPAADTQLPAEGKGERRRRRDQAAGEAPPKGGASERLPRGAATGDQNAAPGQPRQSQ